jgi:ribosomal protein L37AE/L43A
MIMKFLTTSVEQTDRTTSKEVPKYQTVTLMVKMTSSCGYTSRFTMQELESIVMDRLSEVESNASGLLPCPFCKSENVEYEFSGSQGYIECKECWAMGPYVVEAADPICDTGAAKRAWNNR